jgi:predicted cation transporter
MLIAGLSTIFFIVLLGPFVNRRIERNLEGFLFLMGLISATISNAWSSELVHEGLTAPISITLAVLAAGALFHYLRERIDSGMKRLLKSVPLAAVVCFVTIVLGLLSSVISAIIAALILVEFITVLRLHRQAEVNLTVIACFAIGLGAALTPLGEPLSTIAVSKLSDAPHHATFFYLAEFLGIYIVAAVLVLGVLGIFLVHESPEDRRKTLSEEPHKEKIREVVFRAIKVYVFVMALIFLGAGFKPLIDIYFTQIPPLALFWANMASAILDNATLAAAEIGPALDVTQIKSALLGLLISGGMLIPGNIPNIIAAHSLKIKSTEWAWVGVPLGLALMLITMFLLIFNLV